MAEVDLPSDLVIRSATQADVPAIVRLLADDALGRQRELYVDPLPPSYYAAFERISADANQLLVVLEVGDAVVGSLQITFIPYLSRRGSLRALVEAVRIDSSYRSQGLGERLMRWAIEQARERGCNLMQLTTDVTREDAHRFYKRLGFVPSHVGMKLPLEPKAD